MIYSDKYHKVNYFIESTPIGYSDDFFISPHDLTIRADIPFEYIYHIKIWGQLLSTRGFPLSQVTVKLLQLNLRKTPLICQEAHSVLTDTNGFYLFELENQPLSCYQLIIHSTNPSNNEILSPGLNPCSARGNPPTTCAKPLMDYLEKHFPNTYSYEHLVTYCSASPFITTIYALPSYR